VTHRKPIRRKTLDLTMGKILTTIIVTNRVDQANVKRGIILEDEVRSITLDKVLGDTGATTLRLPATVIAQLGLELLKEVDVGTATGIGKARFFKMPNSLSWVEKELLNVLNFWAGRMRCWTEFLQSRWVLNRTCRIRS